MVDIFGGPVHMIHLQILQYTFKDNFTNSRSKHFFDPFNPNQLADYFYSKHGNVVFRFVFKQSVNVNTIQGLAIVFYSPIFFKF